MTAPNQFPMNFMQQQAAQQGGMGQPGMATGGHAPHGGLNEQQRLWQQMQERQQAPQVSNGSSCPSTALATGGGGSGGLRALSAAAAPLAWPGHRQSPLPCFLIGKEQRDIVM